LKLFTRLFTERLLIVNIVDRVVDSAWRVQVYNTLFIMGEFYWGIVKSGETL